jgi:hypothetical protein
VKNVKLNQPIPITISSIKLNNMEIHFIQELVIFNGHKSVEKDIKYLDPTDLMLNDLHQYPKLIKNIIYYIVMYKYFFFCCK